MTNSRTLIDILATKVDLVRKVEGILSIPPVKREGERNGRRGVNLLADMGTSIEERREHNRGNHGTALWQADAIGKQLRGNEKVDRASQVFRYCPADLCFAAFVHSPLYMPTVLLTSEVYFPSLFRTLNCRGLGQLHTGLLIAMSLSTRPCWSSFYHDARLLSTKKNGQDNGKNA